MSFKYCKWLTSDIANVILIYTDEREGKDDMATRKKKKTKISKKDLEKINEEIGITEERFVKMMRAKKRYTLKELREREKMTQEELGKQFGVSKQTIFQWENGWRTPSLQTIEQYLDFFDVKFEQVEWRAEKK